MKKSEKIISACATILFGILLLVLKDDMISILMSIIGVGLIALGIVDIVAKAIPAAVIKIVCGVFIIVCGWVVVRAVLYILAAILLVFGILSIYYNIKRKVRGCTPLHTATYYIVPALYIAIGVLLLFHKSAAVDIILVLCGLLTVIDGGILLFNAIAER